MPGSGAPRSARARSLLVTLVLAALLVWRVPASLASLAERAARMEPDRLAAASSWPLPRRVRVAAGRMLLLVDEGGRPKPVGWKVYEALEEHTEPGALVFARLPREEKLFTFFTALRSLLYPRLFVWVDAGRSAGGSDRVADWRPQGAASPRPVYVLEILPEARTAAWRSEAERVAAGEQEPALWALWRVRAAGTQ